MPRYLAPQEANWMLQSGPLPQQTMSGILVASTGFAAALALVWATAGTMVVESRRIATSRTRMYLIEAPRTNDRG